MVKIIEISFTYAEIDLIYECLEWDWAQKPCDDNQKILAKFKTIIDKGE